MTRLHLLFSVSPVALRDCAALGGPGERVVLVDSGTGLLGDAEAVKTLRGAGLVVGALAADVTARGLSPAAEWQGVELIDDTAWVELVAAHPVVLSWK